MTRPPVLVAQARPAGAEQVSVGIGILLLPSFYGLAGWLGALGVYCLSPYDQHFLAETWSIIIYTLFLFVTSIVLFGLSARRSAVMSELKIDPVGDRVWFLIATLIGSYGLYIYIRDFSIYFGGLSAFLYTLTRSSLDIRGAAEIVGGLGFQVSYLSWVAIFFGLIFVFRGAMQQWERLILLGIISFLFLLNLAFVDRTRPIWILVVCLFGFVMSRNPQNIRPARAIAAVAGVPLSIFFFFAVVSGKFDVSTGLFDNFVIYVTGGMGYLDTMVAEIGRDSPTLLQTFLPISKTLKAAGIIGYAPPEILEFRMVPFSTNVGTFLQPLFADGGWTLLLVGLPVLVFGTDWLALACFRSRTLMGRFFWANLTFTMLIGFFVPKYNNTAIYVFALLLIMDMVRRVQSPRSRAAAAAGPLGAAQAGEHLLHGS